MLSDEDMIAVDDGLMDGVVNAPEEDVVADDAVLFVDGDPPLSDVVLVEDEDLMENAVDAPEAEGVADCAVVELFPDVDPPLFEVALVEEEIDGAADEPAGVPFFNEDPPLSDVEFFPDVDPPLFEVALVEEEIDGAVDEPEDGVADDAVLVVGDPPFDVAAPEAEAIADGVVVLVMPGVVVDVDPPLCDVELAGPILIRELSLGEEINEGVMEVRPKAEVMARGAGVGSPSFSVVLARDEINKDVMNIDAPTEGMADGTVLLVLPEVVVELDSLSLEVALAGEKLSKPLEKIRSQAKITMPRLYDQRVEAVISIHGPLKKKIAHK